MRPKLSYPSTRGSFSTIALVLVGWAGLCSVLLPYQTQRIVGGAISWVHWGEGASMSMDVSSALTQDQNIAAALKEQLARHGEAQLRIVESKGAPESVARLRRGESHFGILLESALRSDWTGVTAVAALGYRYVHLIVPADSDIRCFRDLGGKKVGVGGPESDAAFLAKECFDFLNLSAPPELVFNQGSDLERAFLDGQIEATLEINGLNAPQVQSLLAKGWYRLVPIPEAESLAMVLPGAESTVFPSNLYGVDREIPKAGESFPTLGLRSLLAARAGAPDRFVYALLGALYGSEFLSRADIPEFTETTGHPQAGCPLHSGAETFYRRHDPVTWRQIASGGQVLVGLAVVGFVTRALLQRRRGRVRKIQRKLIQQQQDTLKVALAGLAKADSPEELSAALRRIAVIYQWADQSFRTAAIPPELLAELILQIPPRLSEIFVRWTERTYTAPSAPAAAFFAPEDPDPAFHAAPEIPEERRVPNEEPPVPVPAPPLSRRRPAPASPNPDNPAEKDQMLLF